MKIIIRRAQLGDLNAVFRLAQQFSTGRVAITKDEFTLAFEALLNEHPDEGAVVLVASSETETISGGRAAQLLGYSLLSVSRLLHAAGLTAHLHEIVVDEGSRGMSVGEKLIRANEQYCRQRGVRQMSASTARMGTFYNHLGFESVGEHYRKVFDIE